MHLTILVNNTFESIGRPFQRYHIENLNLPEILRKKKKLTLPGFEPLTLESQADSLPLDHHSS